MSSRSRITPVAKQGKGIKMKVGAVAIQQALREMGASYRQIAKVAQINPRTAYSHVNAGQGSKVRAWDARSDDEQGAAREAAASAWTWAVQQGRISPKKEVI